MDNILAFVVKIFPPFLDINLPIIVKSHFRHLIKISEALILIFTGFAPLLISFKMLYGNFILIFF